MKDSELTHSQSIRKALFRAVVVPVVLLFILAGAFIYQTSHLLKLSSYVEHTENLLREAFETQKLILDMETGLRGYSINKDAIFLAPYLKAKDEIPAHLAELTNLVKDDPRDVRRVTEILILTQEWRTLVEYRLKQGTLLKGAPAPKRARAAKIRMDRIRVNFDRITRDAETLRNERRSRIETAARRSLKIGLGMAFVLGLVVMFSTFRQVRLITKTFMANLRALRLVQFELQRSHEDLEEKVEERTLALTASNRELEAFCYSVSHDLRSPLRGIDGFAQAVIEDYSNVLDDQGRKYLDFIRSGTQRMGKLIDDLLSLSRLTRVEMAPKEVDLSALVQGLFEHQRMIDPSRKVEMIVQSGLFAKVDAGLMGIAIENLIANAWKFTSKTGNARIEFGSRMADGQIEYFLKDNGAGFDMTYVDKLFGAFQRLHSQNEFQGTGIGLATVRRIIHRHGGHIRGEGKVGEGATFSFTVSGNIQPEQTNPAILLAGLEPKES